MSFGDQFAECFEIAEMFFDRVKISGAVTVITRRRLTVVNLFQIGLIVVVVNRIELERRHAQVFQIRQVVDDALQISAVIEATFAAVKDAF